MLDYNTMYEAINDKYINGELTYEQANELNMIAFEKYSEPYSKTEEDRLYNRLSIVLLLADVNHT